MKTYNNPDPSTWQEILQRPFFDMDKLYSSVQVIIDDVKKHGDTALIKYTKRFDGINLEKIGVNQEIPGSMDASVTDKLKRAISQAKENIQKFHARQLCPDIHEETVTGVKCWQKSVPIEKVGLYIPGGSAPLLSTVLMLGIPAKLAGCREIVLCTPPGKDGRIDSGILYVANLLGINQVFSLGGVQAIAAMAYGTESVPKVNKIFGPGNQFVTAAKQLVSRDSVAIDIPAGPSELAILADSSAIPAFVASDLLSQAEHGADSQVILITDSEKLAEEVQVEIEKQIAFLPRREIAEQCLSNSDLILMNNKQDMIDLVNFYAPEHLIIACEDYSNLSEQVMNAGSVFLGNYSPESAGDYASGTNHTLPTNGWAHAYSGLNMDAFVKKITFQELSRPGLENIGETVMEMARAEALQAHSNAVSIRLNGRYDKEEI
ncbi:MAG: histidinol dehydrogenase [Bacteroidales bacterium]